MRAFRIGYILTLSFLLVLSIVTLTFGYFPAPTGPKPPEYPTYSSTNAYQQQQDAYTAQEKIYQQQQKNFTQDVIVPYAQGVFLGWIIFLVIFQVLGMIFVKFLSVQVGAAFSFSGVWAVLFGPLGGLLWFVDNLVSSFANTASNSFSANPIFQTVGIASVIGVIVMTIGGIFVFNLSKQQGLLPGVLKATS